MNSVIGLKVRASILRTPGDNPGLLFLDGRQWPFTLDNVWKSPVAPSVNMLVDVDFDGEGNITAIAAVDPQQAAKEKLNQIGGEAKEQVDKAVVIASQGVGALASRMGKATLAATVIVWIAWFFMPGLSFSVSFFGAGQTKSFALWNALSFDPNNNMNPGSAGLLNLIVIVGIVAPLVASFIRHPQARYLYAAPLACLLIAWFTIQHEFSQALVAAGIAASISGIKMTPDYGTYVAALASLVVGARALKRPG
jgi:hypothetical protein